MGARERACGEWEAPPGGCAQIGRELRRRAPNLFECEVFRDGGTFSW